MKSGYFLLNKKGDISGKFDQEKYDKLNFWQRLKYKFSYDYRCKFYKPINCVIVTPKELTDKQIKNGIPGLVESDFIVLDGQGNRLEIPQFKDDGNGCYDIGLREIMDAPKPFKL